MTVSLADIEAVAGLVAEAAIVTPMEESRWLQALVGGPVLLKCENLQRTGSFKIRGAYVRLARLSEEERARGVVASSAGNHGLGVALAAKHFGVRAMIFVPRTAPQVKRSGIEALGATVNAEAPDYDVAMDLAIAYARDTGATFVHPCLGEPLIAGQGTVALEILEDLPSLETMILPIGGAGLLAGTGVLLRHVAPRVRILGAQSVHTAAMARSLNPPRSNIKYAMRCRALRLEKSASCVAASPDVTSAPPSA